MRKILANKRINQAAILVLLLGLSLTSFCAEQRPLLSNGARQFFLVDCLVTGSIAGAIGGFTAPIITECIRTSFDENDIPSMVGLATISSVFCCVYGGYIGRTAGKESLLNTPLDIPVNQEKVIHEATKASLLKTAIISSTMTLAVKVLPQYF